MEWRIAKVQYRPEGDLLERLRHVTLLKRPDVYVYRDAAISLEKIPVEDLYPAQRYVLVQELQKVRHLKWELERFGFDLFQLNGYLKIWLDGEDEAIDLLPPVVEESLERNGRMVYLINDGMHRLYLAYLEWVIPQVILVRGVPEDLPYYAYPIPEKWKGVQMVRDLPPGTIKKWHRIQDHHALYRNFNSAFDNVGAPRGYFTVS